MQQDPTNPALENAYKLAQSKGYKKDMSSFKDLISTNENALNNIYKSVQEKGYTKDIDAFKELIGLKKKEDSQPTPQGQSSVSEVQETDGSLDIQDSKGQLVKDIDSGKLDERISQLEKENSEASKSSYTESLVRSWKKGVARLGRDISSVPEFLYDIFAIPQNYLADTKNQPMQLRMITEALGASSLKTDSEQFKDTYGIVNTPKELFNQDIENLNLISDKLDQKYEGGITDNFKNGNYEDGFKLLGLSIMESMPASLAIAVSGGTASIPQILTGTTAVFGAGANEDYKQENPFMNANERTIKAFGKGMAEGVFSTIGTSRIGNAAKEIIAREGKEEGVKILKAQLTDMYTELLKKYPIPSAMLGEGIEEAATQITQNAIDGKPIMEGVSDAFLVGMGSGGSFGVGLEGIKKIVGKEKLSPEDIENVEATKDKDAQIKTELESQVVEGDLKQKEAKDIYDNWSEIKKGLQTVPDDFTPQQKTKAVEIIKERNALEEEIKGKDPSLVEGKKAKIELLNNQLKEIANAETQQETQEKTKSEVETTTPVAEAKSEKGVDNAPAPTVELKEGETTSWNLFGNEDSSEWVIGKKTKTRKGEDAVELSQKRTTTNGMVMTETHIVPISELNNNQTEKTNNDKALEENNEGGVNSNQIKDETTQEETKSEVETTTPDTKTESQETKKESEGLEDTPSPVVELNPKNTSNETQAQGDTVTDGNIQPRVEPSELQGQDNNAQSSIESKPSQETVKVENKPPNTTEVKPKALTENQNKQNKLVDARNAYNKLSIAKKKSPEGQSLLTTVNELAKDLGFKVGTKNNKLSVTNTKGKEAGKIALKEQLPESSQADIDHALSEIDKGVLLWNGDPFLPRVDLGISRADVRKGEADLKAGKTNTVPAKRLTQALKEAKENGTYEYIEGSGGQINRINVPLTERLDSETELTVQELEEINRNEDALSNEYDNWFNSLDENTQNEILEDYENNTRTTGQDAQERESQTNVSNKKEAKPTKQERKESRLEENTTRENENSEPKQNEPIDDDIKSQGISFSNQKNRDSALSKEGAVKQKNARQRKFKRFWQNTFSSSRGLDKKVVREVESLFGELSEISASLKYEASQFSNISKTLKKKFPKEYNQKMRDINDYLSGIPADISFLNKEQQSELDAFRGRIDTLSDKIIKTLEDKKNRLTNESAIERIDKLIETIKGNKGKYMFRQYDAFSNPDYLPSLTGKYPNASAKKRLQDAIDYLVAEDGLTPEEAKTQLLEYLDSIKNSGDFVSASVSGKAKAPFLKKRQDIPEPIRNLLGESKDPVKNYVSTVYKMSNYIANLEYQSKLSEQLDNLGLSSDKMKEGYTKLTSSGEGWDFLQDIYVPEEIKEGIDDLQPLESLMDAPYKMLVQASAATKLFKTVLSPTTTARNFLSGFFLSFNAGFNPLANPKKFINGIQHAWGGKKSQTKLKEENQKLIKLGIIQDGAVSREVLGIMNDFGKNTDKILSKNALDKFMDIMQRLYALGDDSFKVVGFYQWQNRYIKEGFSKSDAEQLAAERIRNGFPTYSKIPRNIQKLRRIPLIGTFPSFTYEVWRTNANNIRFIGQDLKAGRYKMAAQQATGMLVATSTAYAVSELSKSLLGIDDDEDDTTRNMAAPWQKDSKNIYLGKKNGIYEVVDGTAFFPQETILKPLRILFEDREGRNIEDKIKLATKESTSTFLGADILTKTIAEVSLNQNNYGEKIYRGENILEGISNDPDKITNYILRQAGPGLYNNLTEFARANEIHPEFFGEKETSYKEYTNQEALLGLLGLRVSRINYVSGLSSMAAESKEAMTEERIRTAKKLKNSKSITYDDIVNEVKKYQKYNKENHKQIIVGVRGAKKQGIPKSDIEKALKRRGYSKEDIEYIYFGETPKLKPISSTTVKNKEIDLKIGRLKDDPEKLYESIMKLNSNVDTFNYLIGMSNFGIPIDE